MTGHSQDIHHLATPTVLTLRQDGELALNLRLELARSDSVAIPSETRWFPPIAFLVAPADSRSRSHSADKMRSLGCAWIRLGSDPSPALLVLAS